MVKEAGAEGCEDKPGDSHATLWWYLLVCLLFSTFRHSQHKIIYNFCRPFMVKPPRNWQFYFLKYAQLQGRLPFNLLEDVPKLWMLTLESRLSLNNWLPLRWLLATLQQTAFRRACWLWPLVEIRQFNQEIERGNKRILWFSNDALSINNASYTMRLLYSSRKVEKFMVFGLSTGYISAMSSLASRHQPNRKILINQEAPDT